MFSFLCSLCWLLFAVLGSYTAIDLLLMADGAPRLEPAQALACKIAGTAMFTLIALGFLDASF